MNYTLQLHGERTLYQVPPGLYELMTDISREVLRDNPDQIYRYIANYMDTLLKLRTHMKKALEVVDDVIADNKELFAYVDARGLSWSEANKHARVLQRAFRVTRARKHRKERMRMEQEEKLGREPIFEHSPSFIEYFESLGVDYEKANTASLTIQTAFRKYMANQEMKTMERGSTHTIDMIAPPVVTPLVLEKPTARNSKLHVYEQSPSPSVNSGWYKPITDEPARSVKETRSVASSTSSFRLGQRPPSTRDSKRHVYEQTPRPSIDTAWYAAERKDTDASAEARRLGKYKGMSYLERDDSSTKPPLPSSVVETRIPTYFDADQSKVPMISNSGQLDVLEEDVVTLFSTDTITVAIGSGMSLDKERVEKHPSLKNLGSKSSQTGSEMANELFTIIERKSSDKENVTVGSSYRSASKGSKGEQPSLLREVSSISRSLLGDASQKSEDDKGISLGLRPSQYSQRTNSSMRPRSSSRIAKLRVKVSSDEDDAGEQ